MNNSSFLHVLFYIESYSAVRIRYCWQYYFHECMYKHLFFSVITFLCLRMQFLIVMAICTNCVLLVCFYDTEGKWTLEPGLAAILVVEHVLLLMKFVFSRIVPEVYFLP